jgi:predicted nucleic acid-binding protein
MIVVDTDILIWILRGKPEILERFKSLSGETKGNLFITPIQITEIYAGIRNDELVKTEIFLKSFQFLAIDFEIATLSGNFINKYNKSHNVTLADAVTASCAKSNNLKIWTLNKKHYPMLIDEEFVK